MPKLVALHTIVYGKGETALPNTPFDVDADTAAELFEIGAVREPTEAELAFWGAAPKKRGRKAKDEGADDVVEADVEPDLGDLS